MILLRGLWSFVKWACAPLFLALLLLLVWNGVIQARHDAAFEPWTHTRVNVLAAHYGCPEEPVPGADSIFWRLPALHLLRCLEKKIMCAWELEP